MGLYYALWIKVCDAQISESLCTLQLQGSEESSLPSALRVTGEKGLPKSHIIHVGHILPGLLWEVLCIWKQEGKGFSGSLLLFSFVGSTVWKELGSHHTVLSVS